MRSKDHIDNIEELDTVSVVSLAAERALAVSTCHILWHAMQIADCLCWNIFHMSGHMWSGSAA